LKEQKVSRVTKQIVLITVVALVALAFAACGSTNSSGSTGTSGGATDVAAIVNGKNIMLSEVDRLINQQFQGQQSKLSPLQLAQTRLQALETLIQKEVLYQRAEKEGLLPKDDEVTQLLTELKQQSGMTEEQFQQRLKDQGQTVEMLRDEARKSKAIEKLQNQVNAKITIRDEEVQDFYNNNKQSFVNPRGVGLANIVVDPAENGGQDDAKSEAEAKLKIDNIYAQLKSGADFATVARARSEDPSNLQGGDIGFASEDQLKQAGFPQTLIEQFFGSMQVGSFTAPIQMNKRWFIFKLQSKQLQNENLTFESPGVRQQITQALTKQRQDILNAALLDVAMNDAKIVNKLAADMLASPEKMSGLRQATPGTTTTASPAASPAASVTPQATASPAASASPAVKK
jgi:parvulin-like peptidyl-prolyl isomerase